MEHLAPESVAEFNAGVRAMRAGDPVGAANHWRRAIEIDNAMTPAARNLIALHAEARDHARVAELYQIVLADDPFDTDAWVLQAAAFRKAGHPERAIANYEQALRLHPYFRFWYDEIAAIHEAIGHTAAANQWRERAAALDTEEAEMAYDDAVRQLRAGNTDLATTILEAVLDDQPANLDARVHFVRALHGLGRTTDALDALQAGVDAAPAGKPRFLYERARIFAEFGRTADAIAALDQAVTAEPGYGRAARHLRVLRGATAAAPPSPAAATAAPSPPPAAPPPPQAAPPPPAAERAPVAAIRAARIPQPSQAAHAVPNLPAPSPDLPWLEQVRAIVKQALSFASRTGEPGKVALLIEAAEPVAMVTDAILQMLARAEFGLLIGDEPRVYCVEGDGQAGQTELGIRAEGWLGRDFREPRYGRWPVRSEGIAIDRMLEAASLAVGSEGFNVVLVVSTGAVRADQNATESFLRTFPTYQVAIVQPGGAAGDLAYRLDGVAPNLVAVASAALR